MWVANRAAFAAKPFAAACHGFELLGGQVEAFALGKRQQLLGRVGGLDPI